MIAGHIALLMHNNADNDAEIDRWFDRLGRAYAALGTRLLRHRFLRDIEGVG